MKLPIDYMLDQLNTRKWLEKFKLAEFPQPELIQVRHPILLCHGYGAIASVIKPSPLHDACMLLRSHSVVVSAPNIVPYARIEIRAEAWVKLVDQLLAETGAEKLNIVAHSMGGLDMRYALSKLDIADKVASLTTVASPHRGTSLAEFALKAPSRVREKFADFFDWVGNNIYPQIKSDALGPVRQLTREYVQNEFNPDTPDAEGVAYYSYSAAVGEGTGHPIHPITRYQNKFIYEKEGLNDGFVSVESARWGKHLGTIDISHLEQMKLRVDKKRIPAWKSFWIDVVRRLAENGH